MAKAKKRAKKKRIWSQQRIIRSYRNKGYIKFPLDGGRLIEFFSPSPVPRGLTESQIAQCVLLSPLRLMQRQLASTKQGALNPLTVPIEFSRMVGHENKALRIQFEAAMHDFIREIIVQLTLESIPLRFRELKPGDKFIAFPVDGYDAGHEGFKSTHSIFIKIEADRSDISFTNAVRDDSGRKISCSDSMSVIKVR